ncbi:hypothetical protein SAY87_008366 [Trapa incisa]|uniref:Uncharacterized protein n=1 Tax=Trapa incisa TaxID=236973 RepID=A0AAN7KKF0_9MYRT|nr:hypothetical protein SAY87_008366 [Trapa incisa]
MNQLFSKMGIIWSLVKLGHITEGLRTLRACKGELAMLASEPSGISATVALTEQYPREIAFQVKLLQPEICCYEITMRKSSAVLFQTEHLQEEAYMKPSSFVTELEKATVNTVSSITPDEGTQSFLSREIRAFWRT